MKNNHATQRTIKLLRAMGFKVWKTEQWNSFARVRQDMFKIIDVLAITPDTTLGVQSTTWAGRRGHLGKLCLAECQNSSDWLAGPARRKLWLVSWRKELKKRGGKANIWVPYIDVINADLSVTALNLPEAANGLGCQDAADDSEDSSD